MRKLSFTLLLLILCFANGFTQDLPAVNYTTVGAGSSVNLPDNTPVIQNSDAMILWALPAAGGTSGNTRAPGNMYKYQRTEYLITASEMAAAGFTGGITINSIGFLISTVGTGTITGTLNVYLMNTSDATYSLGTNWTTTGFTQVHNDTGFIVPISPANSYDIPFSGGSPFTYTGGGVYVAWEFNSPLGTVGSVVVNHWCNLNLTNGLYGQRSNTSMPTALVASAYRPATRFGTPDLIDIIAVTNIYTTEKVPAPFGTPTPLDVRVSNVSASPVSSFNLTMTVKDSATSTVRYTATLPVPDLAAGGSARLSFTGWSPTTLEKVIYTASTSTIPGETFPFNNTLNLTGVVNDNLFSYSYKNTVGTGYGFLYPGGGIFAAKYHMTGTGIVPATNVLIFNHTTVTGNKVLGVVLNSTGNIVAISDTLVVQTTDLGLYHTFVFNSPAVFTNEDFYVGLAQIPGTATYYPLSMQIENPQRGNTFYTFPLGGGTPEVETYNGKYMIEAQVSVPTVEIVDVGTLSIDVASSQVPGSVTPKATFKNLGTHPRTFDVQMTITGGYSSTKSVTNLAPGTSQQVTFDNWTAALGEYSVKAWTQAPGDINANNDTLYKSVGVYSGSWTNGSVYPTTTYLGGGAGYVSNTETTTEYLFSIGGNTTSTLGTECYKYNVTTDAWTPIASLPAGRRVLATAIVGDYLYAIGGSDLGSVYQTTVYKYDIAGDSWTTVAPIPAALGWGKAVGYNNRIYLAGGIDASSNELATVYVYNIAGDSWATATSMPAPKFGGAFAVTGNKLVYAAGADTNGISNSVYVGTIDGTDPLVIGWTAVNKFPGISDKVFQASNVNPAEVMKNDFSIASNIDAIYPPGTMYRFDGAPWGTDGIIVAGGSPTSAWDPANPNPTYIYNPSTDTWTKQGDVPVPVLGASLGTVHTGNTWKLIVASGLGTAAAETATQIWTDNLNTAPTTFPLTVNVAAGWNMVSVPGLLPTNQNVTSWWPGKDPAASVFRFQSGYQPVTVASPGQGYWMKNLAIQTYNTGDEWPAGGIQIVTHAAIPGLAGWNMIGGYEQTVNTSGLTTTPPGLITGTVYKYTPGSGYQAATQLVPGYGYWVKLTGAGSINVPSGAEKGIVSSATIPESFGRITLTDNTGSSSVLYASDNKTDLSQFDLPPYPPQGMFDIRYSSQRSAENISTPQAIEMMGVQYPVKVKAENTGIILSDETGKEIARLKAGEEYTVQTSGKIYVSGNIVPLVYSLEQNYPNPFNPSTMIQFSIPEDVQSVKLIVYSALGEKVAELVNTGLTAGIYKVNWNAGNIASGLYIYQIVTEKFVSTKKMMLLK